MIKKRWDNLKKKLAGYDPTFSHYSLDLLITMIVPQNIATRDNLAAEQFRKSLCLSVFSWKGRAVKIDRAASEPLFDFVYFVFFHIKIIAFELY